jgi:hypothetical protein
VKPISWLANAFVGLILTSMGLTEAKWPQPIVFD